MMLALAAVAALLAVGSVVVYVLYTLAGVRALRPLLDRPRRAALGIALPLGVFALVGGLRTGDAWAIRLAGLTSVAALYAFRRQWVWPRMAAPLTPWAGQPSAMPPDTLVVVLPDGAALPLGWLSHARTAVWGPYTVIYCSLSRGLLVVQTPAEGPPRAWLPHSTGFEVGIGGRRWDGVDGHALDGGEPLVAVPARLTTVARWRSAVSAEAQAEGAALLAVPGHASLRSPRLLDVPVVPAARGVDDGTRLGAVDGERWRPWQADDATLHRAHLARWAARARGLRGTDTHDPKPSAAPA